MLSAEQASNISCVTRYIVILKEALDKERKELAKALQYEKKVRELKQVNAALAQQVALRTNFLAYLQTEDYKPREITEADRIRYRERCKSYFEEKRQLFDLLGASEDTPWKLFENLVINVQQGFKINDFLVARMRDDHDESALFCQIDREKSYTLMKLWLSPWEVRFAGGEFCSLCDLLCF
jgi:hypothetical protein